MRHTDILSLAAAGARSVTAGRGREWGLWRATPVTVEYWDSRADARTERETWIR